MSETAVIRALDESGPLTGSELVEKVELEPLDLWRCCTTSPRIMVRVLGRRFLRLDRAVTGYARLSPSIRREFLTYTLLDLTSRQERLEKRAADLTADTRRVSVAKRNLAAQTVATVVESQPARAMIRDQACFVLAGDITYEMAHRVPRPERSTGKLVRGSDLDIVVVTGDDFDPAVREALDDAIYQKKHFLLVSPSYREEVDYLIKDLATVRRQVAFDTFEHMVACKILVEGELLHGSGDLFASIRGLLAENEVPSRLADMEEEAVRNRTEAEQTLRQVGREESGGRFLNLFYTSDEGDEIY
ncbi:MAG: hypothetical protein ABH877_04430 [bacterium]